MAGERIMTSSPDPSDSDMTATTSKIDTVNLTEMPADVQATLKGYLPLGE
jgi:hypothetical protein